MSPSSWRNRLVLPLFCALILSAGTAVVTQQAVAQQPSAQPPASEAAPAPDAASNPDPVKDSQAVDPLKRPIDEKKKKENANSLKQELSKTYKKWLDEDVVYIITPAERKAFKQLSNDEERDQFMESFWQRRNPNPESEDNEFKNEHYRRIEYANDHFAAGIPGWRSDRGRMYIKFGPPDEIDSHPSGGAYSRPIEEGGGETSTFPFEDWRYRHLDEIGEQVEIEFVDSCMCGDYHMTMDKNEKDALLHVPNAGLTYYEQMGLTNKADRVENNGIYTTGENPMDPGQTNSKEFDILDQYAKLNAPPPVKFKDLEEIVKTRIRYNLMPFDVRVDFVKVTSDTVLVPITIQVKNRDVTFVNKEGIQRGTVNIFGRVTTLAGRPLQPFEDTVQVDVPAELLPKATENSSVYWKALPLRPGRYRLDIAVNDVNGDRKGTWSKSIIVPDFADDRLDASSLIVADQMEPVASKNIGTGFFVIGSMKVRPRVASSDGKPVSFKRNQKLNFWMQVYNLSLDDKTHKPSATIEYNVVNAATNKNVIHTVESTDHMGNIGDQMTLQKTLAASNLDPGIYRIQIKVNDNLSKQTVDPSATFAVE
jgi:GWxTD domain-containing protein